jgi:hypothetical protein
MKILFEDCVRVENDLFFICRDFNAVCKIGIENGKIEFISNVPEENEEAWRLGAKIVYWNKFLFFAPMSAKKIWKYNLEQDTWIGYERKQLDAWAPHGDMFQAVLFEDKIFFIGCLYPAIIVMDLKSDSMEYVTKPYERKIALAKAKNDCCFRTDYIQIDKYIYMASCIDNTVLKFNMKTYDFEYIEVASEDNMYAGIGFDGEEFYLAPRKKGKGVIWNPNYEEIRYIDIPFDNEDNKAVFGGVVCLKNKVIFPACFSNETVEIQINDNTPQKLLITGKQYTFYKKIDDETIVSLTVNGEIEIITPIRTYKYITDISDYEVGKCLGQSMRKNGNVAKLQFESKERTLGLFLGEI